MLCILRTCISVPERKKMWKKNVKKDESMILQISVGNFFLLIKEGGNAEELEEGALTL